MLLSVRLAAGRCASRQANASMTIASRLSSPSVRYAGFTAFTTSALKRNDDNQKPPPSRPDQTKPVPLASKLAEKLPASLKPGKPNQPVEVHEDIYTIPNALTFSRLVAAPFVGYFVLHDQHALAAGLFAYAGFTDLLDGWIARRWNRRTVVGTVIDPMADKALMTILTVCLAIKGALPGRLTIDNGE
jgi:cardiolipin synthase